jgi:hypothetical protein
MGLKYKIHQLFYLEKGSKFSYKILHLPTRLHESDQ